MGLSLAWPSWLQSLFAFLQLLLIPLLVSEPALSGFHGRIKTSGSPGTFRVSSAGLGVPRHTSSWVKVLAGCQSSQ